MCPPRPNPTPTPATPPAHIALPLRVNEDNDQIGDVCDAHDEPFTQVQHVSPSIEPNTLERLRMRREHAAYIVHCCNSLPTVAKERDEALDVIESLQNVLRSYTRDPEFYEAYQDATKLINRLRG